MTKIHIKATPAAMKSTLETLDVGRGRTLDTFQLMQGAQCVAEAQFLNGKFMRANHSPGKEAIAEAWVKDIIATAKEGATVKPGVGEPAEARA